MFIFQAAEAAKSKNVLGEVLEVIEKPTSSDDDESLKFPASQRVFVAAPAPSAKQGGRPKTPTLASGSKDKAPLPKQQGKEEAKVVQSKSKKKSKVCRRVTKKTTSFLFVFIVS